MKKLNKLVVEEALSLLQDSWRGCSFNRRWSNFTSNIKHAPLLKAAAPHIAHRAICNLGTWGGSLAYGDPTAEWPACSLTLRATMIIQGPAGASAVFLQMIFSSTCTPLPWSQMKF
ncbi:MAG TPA: hypothetical protein DCW35_04655 [Polynucleobacter sp.]|nr:hypothetical protein [Polynucleobacter sp.]